MRRFVMRAHGMEEHDDGGWVMYEEARKLQAENNRLRKVLESCEMLETLADQEHDRWSKWMNYLFSIGIFNEDGTWTMPEWAVARWQLQAQTDYYGLTEREKESDRKEARETLAVIKQALKGGGSGG